MVRQMCASVDRAVLRLRQIMKTGMQAKRRAFAALYQQYFPKVEDPL